VHLAALDRRRRNDRACEFAFAQTDHEQDMVALGSRCLNVMAAGLVNVQLCAEAIELVLPHIANLPDASAASLASSASSHAWHVRKAILPFLRTVAYGSLLDVPRFVSIVWTISGLLHDSQLEVRELASQTLAGLLRCAPASCLVELRAECCATLSKKRARTEEPEPPAAASAASAALAIASRKLDLAAKQHGAILGLSALVLAFPLELPDWMPDVLMVLAKFGDMPNPIKASVARTLKEFRRTHQDMWFEHKQAFTPLQLDIIETPVAPPLYYA
jgi:proteasome activator subunit 4